MKISGELQEQKGLMIIRMEVILALNLCWQKFFAGMATYPISGLPGIPERGSNDSIPGYDDHYDVPVDYLDGVLINTYAFGINKTPVVNLGRTATHEIGHFLGLLHIWGNGIPSSCEHDDFCEDTPPTSGQIFGGCSSNRLACDGRPAMVQNYMEYTDDDCKNIFTNDQIARMHTVLENSPRRKTLLTSPGLKDPETVLSLTGKQNVATIYPNPADERVQVLFNQNLAGRHVRLTAYSVSGEVLVEHSYMEVLNGRVELNVPSSFAGKLVMFEITTENIHEYHKVILKR